MAAGSSEVTICANAVRRLGGQTFTAFTDDVIGAGLCGDIYPGIRDGVLGEHDWHFTFAKAQLSRDVAAPITQFKYQFTLPPDRLEDAPLRVFNSDQVGVRPLIVNWEIFGQKMHSDQEELWIDYYRRTVEDLWPAWFDEAMTLKMMAELAFFITDSPDLALNHDRKAQRAMQEAMTRNAQGNLPRVMDDSSIIDARFGPV